MGNFLFGFAINHAHYIVIRVTILVYYREGGRQCCFMSLPALLFDRIGPQLVHRCHWTAENVDHILEFGDKMNLDSLQEGLIPDTKMPSISNLPFAVHWIAESSKAIGFPTSQTRTHARTTLAKNKTYQPTLAQTKDILHVTETLDTKTEGQNWSIKYNILNQARQQLFYLW